MEIKGPLAIVDYYVIWQLTRWAKAERGKRCPARTIQAFSKATQEWGGGEGGGEKPSAPFATQTVHLLLLLPRIFASGKERVGKNTAQWLKKKKKKKGLWSKWQKTHYKCLYWFLFSFTFPSGFSKVQFRNSLILAFANGEDGVFKCANSAKD